jgi:riboflavin synthase
MIELIGLTRGRSVFTGIVETTGTIEALGPLARGARRISISTSLPLGTVPKGGSIAVDGVCLTLISRRGRRFDADLGPETLSLTTLGTRRAGDVVHLERPLRIGDPLGGHLVAGHVDGTGTVARTRRSGDCLTIEITAPPPVAPFLAVKGSITIDGVSLTVNAVKGATFSVTLIPHTLQVTRLGSLSPGDKVNLEADLIAKHVAHLIGPSNGRGRKARRERHS